MNYTVTGADKQSGDDAQLTLAAGSVEEAERLAVQKGILVANIRPVPGAADEEAIELWDEDPATAVPAARDNSQPAPPARTAVRVQAPDSAQYHVVQNPALYLLESAVNKHMKEGWEPLGGIQVSNWNNQIQYFQGMVRRQAPAS